MRLEELGISLTLPEGLAVYTQEGPVDTAHTLPPEDVQYFLDVMTERKIYLLAMDPGAYEIQVKAEQVSFSDMDHMDDESLDVFAQTFAEVLVSAGAQVEELRFYHSPYTSFLFTRHYFPELGQYCHQYLTSIDGVGFSITLYSLDGPVTEERASTVRSLVDSLRDDDPPSLQAPEMPLSPGFTYTEPESNTTIQVPEGWLRGYVDADAKFSWSLDRSRAIVFTVTALPPEVSPLKKMLGIRTDPFEYLSEADIAEEFGVDPAQVTILQLNGKKWFRISGRLAAAAFGQEGTAQTVLLFRSADGWQYRLHYLGTVEDPQYEDLEAMATGLYTPSPTRRSTPELRTLAYALLCWSTLFTLLVLLRWRKARRVRKCPRCGRTKDKGASYCINCGQRLS